MFRVDKAESQERAKQKRQIRKHNVGNSFIVWSCGSLGAAACSPLPLLLLLPEIAVQVLLRDCCPCSLCVLRHAVKQALLRQLAVAAAAKVEQRVCDGGRC